MPGLDRRMLITAVAGLAAIAVTRVFAHEGHDHGAATPDATPEGELGTGTGAVFMTIANNGAETDKLVSASTTVARFVQVHQSASDGAAVTMQHLEHGLDIPAGETVMLEPGGYHLMLVDLNEDILPESTVVLSLEFALAGSMDLNVPVALERLDDVPAVAAGDLEITGYWSRPAPRLSPPSNATPDVTPRD